MKLKPWDGREPSGRYQYPRDQLAQWNMQIDDRGTVYYTPHGEPSEPMFWCAAGKLTRHMHRLEQLGILL